MVDTNEIEIVALRGLKRSLMKCLEYCMLLIYCIIQQLMKIGELGSAFAYTVPSKLHPIVAKC